MFSLQLEKVHNENNVLLGKHIAEAQQMRNEEINVPNTLDVCVNL